MKRSCLALLGLCSWLLPLRPLAAQTLRLEGVHLCCKSCVEAVENALDVEGVTDFQVDRRAKTIVIETNAPAEALESLGRAGFFGRVVGADPKLPEPAQDDAPARTLKLTGAHLCCGQCQKAIVAAIGSLESVAAVDIEDGVVTVTATAAGAKPGAVLEAIHGAGFHGQVERVER